MGASPDPGVGRPLTVGTGPGWAQLATAVAAQVPPAEIETIYLFRPQVEALIDRPYNHLTVTGHPATAAAQVADSKAAA